MPRTRKKAGDAQAPEANGVHPVVLVAGDAVKLIDVLFERGALRGEESLSIGTLREQADEIVSAQEAGGDFDPETDERGPRVCRSVVNVVDAMFSRGAIMGREAFKVANLREVALQLVSARENPEAAKENGEGDAE